MVNYSLGRLAASAAIIKDKRILLIKRSMKCSRFPGFWSFPSGGIQPKDSSIEACVIREVLEEVSLEFKPKEKFGFYESISNNKRYVALIFLGDVKGEISCQRDEVSEAKFFSYEEIKSLEIAFVYGEVIDDLYHKTLIR